MRVVRTILGILLITVGLPLVLAGAGLWTAMQHRDAGGAFSGDVEAIRTSGYAVVVPDVDALLRRQAPFARSEGTHLRVAAQAGGRPAFVGLAPAADAARYLAGTEHTRLTEVRLARGELPVRGSTVRGAAGPPGAPGNQRFWAGSGVGALDWSPAEVGDRSMSLVIMAADGQRPGTVTATAELRPGWLNSSAWGLLILGSLLLLLGIGALAWPSRTREIVYVVDPAQVPDIAARLGVPVPDLTGAARLRPRGSDPGSGGAGPGRPAAIPSSRPATLAETAQPQPQPAASVAVGPASVAPVPPVAGGAEPAPPAAA
ncbi:MAG TPA: hypothetical protein VES42_05260, partial [Pilimelia sp.]|nr:hypothetical protein [Pilimelia sp.]